MENKISFSDAIDRASANRDSVGIGTYSEKMLHKTLKFYFEPDESKHEIPYCGMVADILNESGVIEIQTRSLGRLLPKLELFLKEGKVTVVYPIIERKYISRVDTETGESFAPRKSSKTGKLVDALPEIAAIRKFIPDSRLTVLVVLVDVIETRMLNGRIKVGRKRTQKLSCQPISLNCVVRLNKLEDYIAIIPTDLPDEFTAAEFEKKTKLKGIDSHASLMLLLKLGILSREKRGTNAYIYSKNTDF